MLCFHRCLLSRRWGGGTPVLSRSCLGEGEGYPLDKIKGTHTPWQTGYTTGGAPVEVTQEDFLLGVWVGEGVRDQGSP